MMRIYVASPLGFSEAGRAFYCGSLLPELRRARLIILDPWRLTDPERIRAVSQMPFGEPKREAWKVLNSEIAKANQSAIDNCDGILAILDGSDVDSGTSAEIGYGFAKGKKIIGYRGDFRLSSDNEGCTVNLQVEYFIRCSGGVITSSLSELIATIEKVFGGDN